MTAKGQVERLVELVAAGTSVGKAEREVGMPSGDGRPALVGWARDQGLGYAALASHLGANKNTVKSWFRRYGDEQPTQTTPQPVAQRAPTAADNVEVLRPDRNSKERPAPSVDLAQMDREDFLVWLVDDIGTRLQASGLIAAGTAPQLVSQLRQARDALDEHRAELKTQRSDLDETMTEEELLEKLQDLADELPDAHLEVYVAVYLERHGLRLEQAAAGA